MVTAKTKSLMMGNQMMNTTERPGPQSKGYTYFLTEAWSLRVMVSDVYADLYLGIYL